MIHSHSLPRDFDLNLIRPLHHLLETRSVTLAARELSLTQSAVSRSLARLRDVFGDPLLVREGQHMELTERGDQLRPLAARLLVDCSRLVSSAPSFDPASARDRVRLATADFTQVFLLPRLLEHLRKNAPGIDIEALPDEPKVDKLESGEVDFSIRVAGTFEHPNLIQTPLFTSGFSCLLRRGHPALGRRLTVRRYAALDHVLVAPGGRPGGLVDRMLVPHGLERRVAVMVPSFGVAPSLIASSNCIATLPTQFAHAMARRWNLVCLPVPLEIPRFQLVLYWMERRRNEGLHSWLRQVMRELTADLGDE